MKAVVFDEFGGSDQSSGSIVAGVQIYSGGWRGTGTSCTWKQMTASAALDRFDRDLPIEKVVNGVRFRLYERTCGSRVTLVWIARRAPRALGVDGRAYLSRILPAPVIASGEGEAVSFVSRGAFAGARVGAWPNGYGALRDSSGWPVHPLSAPIDPVATAVYTGSLYGASADTMRQLVGTTAALDPAAKAGDFNLYVHDSAGAGYELSAIAIVVIGGTHLAGGRGGIGQTLVGTLTIGYLEKILSINAVPEATRLMLTGAIVIAAVLTQRRGDTR